MLARPVLPPDAPECEKDKLLSEQAKTIRELEFVVKGYEDNLGEPLRKVKEDVEREWSARLEKEVKLREEKGYTYGAYTRFDVKRLAGDFEATAEVRTAVTGDSLKEFFYELERIRNERVPESERSDTNLMKIGTMVCILSRTDRLQMKS